MAESALSLHLGLCGVLADTGPRYLPCSNRGEPAITDEPEVLMTDNDGKPFQSVNRSSLFDPNMKERKDEIDALRARVDVILNKMVQNSGDDVTRLRQKIAEMRTGPPQAPTPRASGSTKLWNTADPKNCPLSPMTTNTAITTITQNTAITSNTNNSATPSAETELHGNLSFKKQPVVKNAEGSLLNSPIMDDERDDDDDEDEDDDEDIDDMEFDFKVAPLTVTKSVQIQELGSMSERRRKKESKDPPASLKASESMLPDPGGDESYCSTGSEGSRSESPPPDSALYEAAARKADSVLGREREQQEQLEREQLQQQLLKTKQLLQQQQDMMQKQNQRKSFQSSDNEEVLSRTSKVTHKSVKTCPVPETVSARHTSSVPSRLASMVKARSPFAKEEDSVVVIDAEEREDRYPVHEVIDTTMVETTRVHTAVITNADVVSTGTGTPFAPLATVESPQQKLERSKSPPPPVANVNIPNIVKPLSPDSEASVGSHSDSSLTRPPSPTAAGDVTMIEEVSEQRIRDPYGDKGIYSGVLVKRRPHGRGTMKYDDGRHYEGNWNHGRWHGVGRAIFANNDVFEGSYDMDQRHGHGMYQWNDGRVYTGQFFQDQRQGRGTYTWPDGAVYQGEFKAGHRHGQGMYRFADGSVYTGEWENGKYHGVGECRWSDGRSYRGEWKEGRANGYGVETRPNGTIRHDGEWKDDRPIRDSKKNQSEAIAK